MKIIDQFPRAVRVIENCWIPLSDGCRLAARIWLPADAETSPVPGILEYIPYRKRDFTRARDEPMHHYFAGHGYAAVRVDLRGSGDSDGLLVDEYLKQEHDDALEVIRWIAQQPWCTGAVGMMGKSWGGFNSLQVAACRPPALKAILTVCSTDDRYADDVHYMGGCLLNENLTWGSVLMSYNAYPPDPDLVGERWRTMWRDRLENAVFFPAVWLEHSRRDDYWKHGSVCENYGAITCPVYAVGGWADAYSNAIPRLLAGLKGPRKAVIGPWAHLYPHNGVPGPAIGFLQEALRWWDHWLKGTETGIMAEPMLRVWMQESVPPKPSYKHRPGRWVAESQWPSPRITLQRYWLDPGRLSSTPTVKTQLDFRSPLTTGLDAGEWCGFGLPGESPMDQRGDDGRSLTFDSEPLRERIEILGAPVVTLEVMADQPVALIAVRLNDVARGGVSTRVTYGLLNLTHRDSHEQPKLLEPGKRYQISLTMNDVAHAFPAGHKLRLAISTSYWPVAWPAPAPVTASLFTGESFVGLPVRPPNPRDSALRPFEPPERAAAETMELRPAALRRVLERDRTTNETIYTVSSGHGDLDRPKLTPIKAIGLEVGHTMLKRFRIGEEDPALAQAEVIQKTWFCRNAWRTRVETRTWLSSSAADFLLKAELTAYENDALFFKRTWNRRIKRDLL
ncbi:MAG TPA: CocE/NonD family hydrolase [Candidatus Binatia bacterium]|nr:CocE/NonD family hydrolase [Candidatus Binatia bacterium]